MIRVGSGRLSRSAVVAVLVAGVVSATPEDPGTAEPRSEVTYREFVTESYEVETPHGTIRGDVKRPVTPDGVRVPVILTYTPYSVLYEALAPGRESRADDATAEYFAPRGYARAVFDVVGTYGSSGCTDFGGLGERETAAAVVDFLGTQPWSNGRVGMIGGSYDGTTAIAAAVEAPEHLVTIVPQVAIDRWYDYMFNDGVRLTLEDNTTGLVDPPIDSPADYDLLYGVVPPYPQLTEDPVGVAGVLADHAQPCDRVDNQRRGYETDPVYDAFWVERDYRALAHRVQASVLLEGAWLDDNVKHWATPRFFAALPPSVHKHMVIGQWSHSASRFPDAQQLRHAWFDHFLLGLDTGVLDLLPVETQASDGVRRVEPSWPPPGTREIAFEVTDGPATGTAFGTGGAAARWVDADPSLTEDRIVEGTCHLACLRLAAAPFEEDVRIAGSPRVELVATTDAVSTHVVPHLLDVAPDGSVQVVTRGMLNSRNRNGLDRSEDLAPGRPWTATIELWDTDWIVHAGHTLVLVLTSVDQTWGLPDQTRASTQLDVSGTRVVLPLQRPAS